MYRAPELSAVISIAIKSQRVGYAKKAKLTETHDNHSTTTTVSPQITLDTFDRGQLLKLLSLVPIAHGEVRRVEYLLDSGCKRWMKPAGPRRMERGAAGAQGNSLLRGAADESSS